MTQSPGDALRVALTVDRVYTDSQTAVLDQACALADELARLEAALAGAPTLVKGSLGQERTHPLFAETRATRALLAKLIAQLNPMTGEVRRDRAARAARSRWSTSADIGTPSHADRAALYRDL